MLETPAKKSGKASAPKSKKKDDDDDDDDDADGEEEEEVDDWNKPEEGDEWDPDFDEFDIPRSKTKKAGPTGSTPKKSAKGTDEDDLGLDDFKSDMFNDNSFDEEDDF